MLSPLITLGALASLLTLRRRVPTQNLLVIATIILFVAGAIELLAAKTGIPFEPARALHVQTWTNLIPWPAPAVWMIFLLNTHHLARFIVHRMRPGGVNGLWVLSLSALLTGLFWVALDVGIKSANIWSNCAGRVVTSGVILLLVFPWTLDKRKRSVATDVRRL